MKIAFDLRKVRKSKITSGDLKWGQREEKWRVT